MSLLKFNRVKTKDSLLLESNNLELYNKLCHIILKTLHREMKSCNTHNLGLWQLCGNNFGNFDSRYYSGIIPEKLGNNCESTRIIQE